MSLWRTWLRAAVGASGAALLVPVALLVAVAVTASIGGSGAVGGLGQLFQGPTLPPSALATAGTTPVKRLPTPLRSPAVALAPDPAEGALPAVTLPRETSTTRRRSERRRRRQTSRQSPQAVAQRPRPQGQPTPTTPTTAPPAPPSEDEPESEGPVRDLVKSVNDGAIRPLPVVGEPAADVVQTVVDLVVPPPPAETRAAEPAPVQETAQAVQQVVGAGVTP